MLGPISHQIPSTPITVKSTGRGRSQPGGMIRTWPRPSRRSRKPSATSERIVAAMPTTIAISLIVDGEVLNRVSTCVATSIPAAEVPAGRSV